MAALPLLAIVNSVKNAKVCFNDPQLKQGNVEIFNGRPISYSGGYSTVFKFDCSNKVKAVRIWTKDLTILPELPARAKILADKIQQLKNSCFMDFEFQEKGLLVSGQWTPIVVMEWCKGLNLKDAIVQNLSFPDNLKIIAQNFLKLIRSFHKEGISHGDLQHGNILIADDFTIKLIDYDSLYIPCTEFDNKIEEIKGLDDYQHPNRKQNKYANSKVDYFSELIIYLSLVALAEKPSLWKMFNIANKDYSLLFEVSDFADLKNSLIYKELNTLSDEIKWLVKVLEKYLTYNDINKLEPFETVITSLGGHLYNTSSESLYCINCGKEFYSNEDIFCMYCGTKRV